MQKLGSNWVLAFANSTACLTQITLPFVAIVLSNQQTLAKAKFKNYPTATKTATELYFIVDFTIELNCLVSRRNKNKEPKKCMQLFCQAFRNKQTKRKEEKKKKKGI